MLVIRNTVLKDEVVLFTDSVNLTDEDFDYWSRYIQDNGFCSGADELILTHNRIQTYDS